MEVKCFRWWTLIVILGIACISEFRASSVPIHAAGSTSTFWVQTLDSCRHAVPGAFFVLQGNGLNDREGPGSGTKEAKVGSGSCPVQRGNCQRVPVGCVSWNIPIPASGSETYAITETLAPPNFIPCTGGSVCTGDPAEVVTLKIDSRGAFSATVRNVYPDGYIKVWPTTGAPYTGTQTNPAVVHDFQLGTGSCDGDGDDDDRLTGSPSSHCDNDTDRWKSHRTGLAYMQSIPALYGICSGEALNSFNRYRCRSVN